MRLKTMLMQGAWPPGERLEALRLADEFGVSMTPVRDCLNQLVGARLVELKHGEGFRVARITEQSLRDMLDLNLALLDVAIRCPAPASQPWGMEAGRSDHAARASALFDAIALRAGNEVLSETVRSLSERMYAIRQLEPDAIPDAAKEVEELERLAADDDPALGSRVRNYHELLRSNSSALIRLLY